MDFLFLYSLELLYRNKNKTLEIRGLKENDAGITIRSPESFEFSATL
jgi:hypothetical protein